MEIRTTPRLWRTAIQHRNNDSTGQRGTSYASACEPLLTKNPYYTQNLDFTRYVVSVRFLEVWKSQFLVVAMHPQHWLWPHSSSPSDCLRFCVPENSEPRWTTLQTHGNRGRGIPTECRHLFFDSLWEAQELAVPPSSYTSHTSASVGSWRKISITLQNHLRSAGRGQ
jgi:hypothetical protein